MLFTTRSCLACCWYLFAYAWVTGVMITGKETHTPSPPQRPLVDHWAEPVARQWLKPDVGQWEDELSGDGPPEDWLKSRSRGWKTLKTSASQGDTPPTTPIDVSTIETRSGIVMARSSLSYEGPSSAFAPSVDITPYATSDSLVPSNIPLQTPLYSSSVPYESRPIRGSDVIDSFMTATPFLESSYLLLSAHPSSGVLGQPTYSSHFSKFEFSFSANQEPVSSSRYSQSQKLDQLSSPSYGQSEYSEQLSSRFSQSENSGKYSTLRFSQSENLGQISSHHFSQSEDVLRPAVINTKSIFSQSTDALTRFMSDYSLPNDDYSSDKFSSNPTLETHALSLSSDTLEPVATVESNVSTSVLTELGILLPTVTEQITTEFSQSGNAMLSSEPIEATDFISPSLTPSLGVVNSVDSESKSMRESFSQLDTSSDSYWFVSPSGTSESPTSSLKIMNPETSSDYSFQIPSFLTIQPSEEILQSSEINDEFEKSESLVTPSWTLRPLHASQLSSEVTEQSETDFIETETDSSMWQVENAQSFSDVHEILHSKTWSLSEPVDYYSTESLVTIAASQSLPAQPDLSEIKSNIGHHTFSDLETATNESQNSSPSTVNLPDEMLTSSTRHERSMTSLLSFPHYLMTSVLKQSEMLLNSHILSSFSDRSEFETLNSSISNLLSTQNETSTPDMQKLSSLPENSLFTEESPLYLKTSTFLNVATSVGTSVPVVGSLSTYQTASPEITSTPIPEIPQTEIHVSSQTSISPSEPLVVPRSKISLYNDMTTTTGLHPEETLTPVPEKPQDETRTPQTVVAPSSIVPRSGVSEYEESTTTDLEESNSEQTTELQQTVNFSYEPSATPVSTEHSKTTPVIMEHSTTPPDEVQSSRGTNRTGKSYNDSNSSTTEKYVTDWIHSYFSITIPDLTTIPFDGGSNVTTGMEEVASSTYTIEETTWTGLRSTYVPSATTETENMTEIMSSSQVHNWTVPDNGVFADEKFWVRTVLHFNRIDVSSDLSNFTDKLERAYISALGHEKRNSRPKRQAATRSVVITIIGWSINLSLKQLDLVYIIRSDGNVVPATLAVETLRHLPKEEFQQTLDLPVLVQAEAYVRRESLQSANKESHWIIMAAIGGTGVVITILVCCVIVRCRWRKKPTPLTEESEHSSPTYGSHNRQQALEEGVLRLQGPPDSESIKDQESGEKRRPLPSIPGITDVKRASNRFKRLLEQKSPERKLVSEETQTDGGLGLDNPVFGDGSISSDSSKPARKPIKITRNAAAMTDNVDLKSLREGLFDHVTAPANDMATLPLRQSPDNKKIPDPKSESEHKAEKTHGKKTDKSSRRSSHVKKMQEKISQAVDEAMSLVATHRSHSVGAIADAERLSGASPEDESKAKVVWSHYKTSSQGSPKNSSPEPNSQTSAATTTALFNKKRRHPSPRVSPTELRQSSSRPVTAPPIVSHDPKPSQQQSVKAASSSVILQSSSEPTVPTDGRDELDVVYALKMKSPAQSVVEAIREELKRFQSPPLPGTNSAESFA